MEDGLSKQKVSLLLGARRVGKTELLQTLYGKKIKNTLWLNGEDNDTHILLENRTLANYRKLLEGYRLLIIDEAQFIPDISRKVKLMIDNIKPLHIILTGSSAFDIEKMGNPLVGRTLNYHLYPLTQMEWKQKENRLQTQQNLEDRLILGSYPEISQLKTHKEKTDYLRELVNTYLLKDILMFEQINNSQKLRDLLVLLAHQVGNEVSMQELGQQLGMSKNTVERYLDLLTKVFVIYSRSGYSGNLRKEVVKGRKWYFTDNGIRNALIGDFRPLAVRRDVGALWEQYILSERNKFHAYSGHNPECYFWRTYDQQEIDLIEIENKQLTAFECKWNENKCRIPVAFAKGYPGVPFHIINQRNYLEWIGA
ncbi:MAG: ATP-binding protein [Bacteroidetes bacterium]|nr:ATP-binding protein [Bacteroidota bacterium]